MQHKLQDLTEALRSGQIAVGKRSEDRSDSMVEFYHSSDVMNTRKDNSPVSGLPAEEKEKVGEASQSNDYSVTNSLTQPPHIVNTMDQVAENDDRSKSPFNSKGGGPSNAGGKASGSDR